MQHKEQHRFWLAILVFALLGMSTAISAQEAKGLSKGQSLYLPVYSHMLYGNLGGKGKASQVLLSTLVSIRNTDGRRPLRVLSARYFDTNGKLLAERVPTPIIIPPLGTYELFVELNDASGGSGANFVIRWDAEQAVNPPLVEGLHANMDGGKAVIFMTQSVPVAD
ncbi:MAG: DUF3124 domain-containing protein [Rhodocyclales bacterium]|nr:DUF3124 domain-containing protein [Rhodocyclales bacterium]